VLQPILGRWLPMGRYSTPAIPSRNVSQGAHVDFLVKLTAGGLVGHFWADINRLAEVAERLSRSVKTVSSQNMTAMRKLKAKFNQELMAFCQNSGVF